MSPDASAIALSRIVKARCHTAELDCLIGELHRLTAAGDGGAEVGELLNEIVYRLKGIARELSLTPERLPDPAPLLDTPNVKPTPECSELLSAIASGALRTSGGIDSIGRVTPFPRKPGSHLSVVESPNGDAA